MSEFTQDQLDAVREAAKGLNPADDAHWNKDGHPSCNVLKETCGFVVTKQMVAAAGIANRLPDPVPEPEAPQEPPRQATLAQCNAMALKTEKALKAQAQKDAAVKAAAFLNDNT